MQTLQSAIREFIIENFLFGRLDEPLGDHESLVDRGIIDSTGVLELVSYLEQTLGVPVADDELVPDNLDSIACLVTFVERKRAARKVDRAG